MSNQNYEFRTTVLLNSVNDVFGENETEDNNPSSEYRLNISYESRSYDNLKKTKTTHCCTINLRQNQNYKRLACCLNKH